MKILQYPLSDLHKNAMFFKGIIATCDKNNINYVLRTETMPEIKLDSPSLNIHSIKDSMDEISPMPPLLTRN